MGIENFKITHEDKHTQTTADLPAQQRILSEAIGKQQQKNPYLKKKKIKKGQLPLGAGGKKRHKCLVSRRESSPASRPTERRYLRSTCCVFRLLTEVHIAPILCT